MCVQTILKLPLETTKESWNCQESRKILKKLRPVLERNTDLLRLWSEVKNSWRYLDLLLIIIIFYLSYGFYKLSKKRWLCKIDRILLLFSWAQCSELSSRLEYFNLTTISLDCILTSRYLLNLASWTMIKVLRVTLMPFQCQIQCHLH